MAKRKKLLAELFLSCNQSVTSAVAFRKQTAIRKRMLVEHKSGNRRCGLLTDDAQPCSGLNNVPSLWLCT